MYSGERCQVCNGLITLDSYAHLFSTMRAMTLCSVCEQRLQYLTDKQARCVRCAKAMGTAAVCPECMAWQKYHAVHMRHKSLLSYNDFARDLIWKIKHNRDIALAVLFRRELNSFMKRTYRLNRVVFIPIPTDQRSLQQRRFNLPLVLLQQVAGIRYVEYFETIAEKKEKQHQHARASRIQTAKDLYCVTRDPIICEQVEAAQEVILFDDIYTTGATIVRGYLTIRAFFPTKKIGSFTIFRAE